MPITQSKLKDLTLRHAAWLATDPSSLAEKEMLALEDLAGNVNKMGLKSAAIFLEHAAVGFYARQDPFVRKMLALARENDILLSEVGWEDADERRVRLNGKVSE